MPFPDADRHRAALRDLRDRIAARASADPRFLAVALGGSSLGERTDAYSDLDVVLVVADGSFDEVMGERQAFAEALGGLLVSFTGEHVGEPRLVICLYGPP